MTDTTNMAAVPPDNSRGFDADSPLFLYNLLNDFTELKRLLLAAIEDRSWLNAFLLAAGMNQIAEDYLHSDPLMLGKSKKYLSRLPRPIGPTLSYSAEATRIILAFSRDQMPSRKAVVRWQAEFASLVDQLADAVIVPDHSTGLTQTLPEMAENLLSQTDRLPAKLLGDVLRLPSCFRSFDQHPADLECLIRKFTERWPDRTRTITVIGLRTSGSYMAPLCAAFLRANGFENVHTLTIRPGRKLLAHECEMLNAVGEKRGLALITDDPPTTGKSLAAAAQELETFAVPVDSIVLLLQLFSDQTALPPILQKYACVLLEWRAWYIHKQLAAEAVHAALSKMLSPDTHVDTVELLELPKRRWVRSHTTAHYRVQLVQGERTMTREILVKGVGIGYFGEHSRAVSQRLPAFSPEFYGIHDGLEYRAWLPEDRKLTGQILSESGEALADAAAQYVFERHQAFPVTENISFRLRGQSPIWEVASNQLSRAFRRAWWVFRIPTVDPLVKRLLAVNQPSVIDGSMGLSHWFCGDSGQSNTQFLKVEMSERNFSNLDLSCYDPVCDLAGFAASTFWNDSPDDLPVQHLRNAYEQLSGQSISPERWLLYQLVYLWDQERTIDDGENPIKLRRKQAQAIQNYYAETFFRDISQVNDSGAFCALDIDGVLENETIDAPGLTPSSALALRALLRHGYRVVLATGRSLDEVRERCQLYHLSGGVAEYGAVIYDHRTGEIVSQLEEAAVSDLERLRDALRNIDGVCLDPDFRHIVRAYRIGREKRRHRLTSEDISLALDRSGTQAQIRAIRGEGQTDFVTIGVDKGTGLRAYFGQFYPNDGQLGEKPLALAVGDTGSDLPMFELAARAFAPAHADDEVSAAARNHHHVNITNQPYQRGLAQATALMIGHHPGGCSVCEATAHSSDTHLLMNLLGIQEHGRWGLIWNALLLTLSVWRS